MEQRVRKSSKKVMLLVAAGLAAQALVMPAASAGKSFAQFNANDELVRPTGYREWIYIGAPLTPNDMNNGHAAFPEFHNVYMDPVSWEHWKSTGDFREGMMIVKELVSVGGKSSSSGAGYFMGDYIGLEAVVKDSSRFPDADKNLGFFRFTTDNHKGLHKVSKSLPAESCASCHAANARQAGIFVQHYPVLRAAKAKGAAGTGGH